MAPSQAPKGGGATATPRPSDAALEQAMLAAEDSRAEDDAALAPLRAGLKGDARLQTLAVRALGRFERASLVPEIAAMLDSPVATVRAEAANALGQAVLRGESGPASIPLTTRARTESDARVLAALARTLGRLPYQQESEIRDAERTILAIADRAATAEAAPAAAAEAPTDRGATPGESEATARRPATAPATAAPAAAEAPPDRVTTATATATERATTLRRGAPNELAATPSDETIILAGVAHGLDALARRAVKLGSLSADTRSRLRKLARHGLASAGRAPAAEAAAAPERVDAGASAASGERRASSAAGAAGGAGPNRQRTGGEASRAAGAAGAETMTEESRRAAGEVAARVRRLAVSALVTARESNVPLLREVLRDPDDQVRRLGVVWLGATEDVPLRDEAFRQAFGDPAAMVRFEVLRTYARVRQTTSIGAGSASVGGTAPSAGRAERSGTWGTTTPAIPAPTPLDAAAASSASTQPAAAGDSPAGECALEVKALDDANANVGLLAIDLLGRCGERQMATDRLTPIISAFFDASRGGAVAQQDGLASAGAGARSSSASTPSPRAPKDARAGADGRAQDDARRDQRSPPSGPQTWHRAAHAVVALARLAPDRASGWLTRAAAHDVWQMRLYAARAAAVMKDRATLDALAADGDDNVREAALDALQALVGHEADAQYLAALDRSDPHLLRTAARALAGTAQKTETAERVLKTFARISAARRETSRDVRLALLDTLDSLGRAPEGKPQQPADEPAARAAVASDAPSTDVRAPAFSERNVERDAVGGRHAGRDAVADTPRGSEASAPDAAEDNHAARDAVVGGPASALDDSSVAEPASQVVAAPGASGVPVEAAIEVLRPYLRDFDPLVARRVAAMLTAWTGQAQAATPVRLKAAAVPSPREIDRMARTRAIVRMARGGTFTLALRPDVAPTNVARFVRLARAGTFNGLTFHRVEPNFVLQGGSPGANEYAGDGPFTRDELDLTSNLRGTVGVSTRGRDTGDGQFYVNLVDNVRLDHNYTVFAEIVEGLPLIDDILEGDVITRIELREPTPPR